MDLDIGDDDAVKATHAKVELGRGGAYCAAWVPLKPDRLVSERARALYLMFKLQMLPPNEGA